MRIGDDVRSALEGQAFDLWASDPALAGVALSLIPVGHTERPGVEADYGTVRDQRGEIVGHPDETCHMHTTCFLTDEALGRIPSEAWYEE